MKSDRREAIRKFSQLNVKHYCGTAERYEIEEIYGNSIFVLSPRGNVTMMCFRTFEAVCLGAIPVLVCSKEECYKTYNFNDNELPFIIAESWDDALYECRKLLLDPNKLRLKQIQNYNWFDNINQDVKMKIRNAISLI